MGWGTKLANAIITLLLMVAQIKLELELLCYELCPKPRTQAHFGLLVKYGDHEGGQILTFPDV